SRPLFCLQAGSLGVRPVAATESKAARESYESARLAAPTRRPRHGDVTVPATGPTLGALAGRRLSAFAARRLLLSGRAALARVALSAAGTRGLSAAARGPRRVRNLCRALLRHPLVLQLLVL